MTEITDAEAAEVLWASSEQGKAAHQAAWLKLRELGLVPSVDATQLGQIVYAAFLAAGWDGGTAPAEAVGHVHDWKVHGKQGDISVNPTGGPSFGLQTTVALMRCAACGDLKTEILRGQWDVRYLTGEWTEGRQQ